MFKIGNALIIDDKINLTLGDEKEINSSEYRSLRSIQKYFLKSSIPFSTVNNLAESYLGALELMKTVPKPDLVVLDLDLDSDGYVLEADRSLIRLILENLYETFGEYILMIYSSQIDEWATIRDEILSSDPNLCSLLKNENVIVMEKFLELNQANSEILGIQITEKQQRYFRNKIDKIEEFVKGDWNNEVGIIAFFFVFFIIIIYLALPEPKFVTSIVAITIITLTSLIFVALNKRNRQV